jgi:hypothetical protein
MVNESLLKNWIETVVSKTPGFLNRLKDKKVSGRFRYSFSGDFKIPFPWGLGNTVFAVKCYYILNRMDLVSKTELAAYIKSFQDRKSNIYDPIIQLLSWPIRFKTSVKTFDFSDFFGERTKRAETRQSFAAMLALDEKPDLPYSGISYAEVGIKRYIHNLYWSVPWGAASHFSHLVFFLLINKELFKNSYKNSDKLLDFAFKELEKYRREDGAWYQKGTEIADYQKVNGGMKVMTAFNNYKKGTFTQPEKLIDLCFSTLNSGNACNHFNIICLMSNCAQQTDYKKNEISLYCKKRLILYQKHWWKEIGGFSFYPENANKNYYGAFISKGLPEPDVHGTHLFLWGLALICNVLGWDEFGLRQPIT